jgi:gamma-glutamyltranspeptidase/glutathione hydrolase
MVATAHYRATEAGVEILEEGGNAVDAAVAAAFALGVCEPAASGLGGQTMMLIHDALSRRTIALDGSSRAPNRASPGALSKPERRMGYLAMTVPSTPACLRYALEQYGTRKLARLLEPAIRLAEQGYEITPLQHWLARRERRLLKEGTAARFFLRDGERPFAPGARFKQPVLAETLRRLAKKGVRDFYSGEIAALIEQDMVRNGGLIHKDDLAQVPRPIERRPVAGHFQGYRVFTFPPPAAGRTLIQMLNVYEHLPANRKVLDTPEGAVVLAEVIRRAFLDRQDRPYDPNFYSQITSKRMLSPSHAKTVARQVLKRFRTAGETTHLSVMDRFGNAVALTQSIENVFGACAAAPELGFLYNSYMNAFEYTDISHPHYMRPNAAPWASVAPTIVFRGKRPWLAIGSPGSERITPSIFQVLYRLQTHTPFAAVDAARLHCSLNGTVSLEASRMRDDIPAALERHGYQLDIRDPYSFYMGCVQMVLREGEEFIGVADPRRDGSAQGPTQ